MSRSLLLLGFLLLALVLAGLWLHVPGADNVGSPALTSLFVAVAAAAAALYLIAVALVLRGHWLGAMPVLLIAAALRVGPLLAPPFLSSDVFRYVWDGEVQVAGINPYLFIPADPALAPLRDDTIYPRINRRDYAPTVYLPVAQMVFRLVAWVSPTVMAMKLAMVLAEFVAMLAMLQLLRLAGLPPARLLIYAWNPLAVWATAGNGHVDALAIGFIGVALLAAATRRNGWAGAALAGAVLVKLLPAAIAPALWQQRAWRLPLVCLATIAACYAAYSGAGRHVLGFLGTYVREEGIAEGNGFWLLAGLEKLGPLPAFAEPAYLALSLALLATLAIWVAFRAPPMSAIGEARHDSIVRLGQGAAILAASLTFAISPHYSWYFPWLALPCCLYPAPSIIFLSVGALLLDLDPLHERFIWPGLLYVPTILLAVRDILVRVRRPGEACMSAITSETIDPRRYFEAVGPARRHEAERPPVCLYLEVTNRCNLLCETCPRTFETLEPPADMDWALFTRIVDQVPDIARAVLHGVGEPMLVRELPRMIRYLKARGTYVLFNTNGTLLRPAKFDEIIATGLDEMRVSLDAADPATYKAVRGKDFFQRIVTGVTRFTAHQRKVGAVTPRVSLWLTGLKETVRELPEFVRRAAEMGVFEVHLQRLVYDDDGFGIARAESSLFEQTQREEQAAIDEATAIGATLGVTLDASGATEPGLSLKQGEGETPWATCRRPWSLMYFTAHGRALPCCIAPFSARGYDTYTLGDATQQSLREIWNGAAYKDFRESLLGDTPPKPCANCGLRWSL